ncbi:cytochrome P450 [Deinococcus maricopensis]|uniref:Linalool 8-monooxygenase n=1 Tax=Deinococcus maricopensis (strain DSM 21211 / LMG 22137 / NRRL B-23946 / LB-34) TaxID=709986 RepID=E8UAQ7_DEIML|nr:cytochrome P450 [Deinococcus maricopensis]ADV68146.1 Linalool 8-monooxygenase [Deinococcus maricopensis DSM 21211]
MTAHALPDVPFDLTDPSFVRDPYPQLAAWRAAGPAFASGPLTFFTRYADMAGILRDRRRFGRTMLHRFSRDELGWPPPDPRRAQFDAFNGNHMLDSEGEKHVRLRSLVARAFTPKRVEDLRPRVEAILSARLDALRGEAFDLVVDVAEPLPVTVIAELLGVPEPDRHRLRPWSAAIVKLYEVSHSDADRDAAERAVTEFSAYLRALAAERRARPHDDLITALTQVSDGSDRLSEQELIDTCILLLNAGHEASVNGLSSMVLNLLRSRAHWDALVAAARAGAGDEVFGPAVEELLRFDTPLPMFERYVLEDTEVAGVPLAQGQRVALLYASGNRDAAAFDRADELVLDRAHNPHLTFGLGAHYCLGAPLARLELRLALRALCARLPELRLVDAEPSYVGGFVIRGLAALRVQ